MTDSLERTKKPIVPPLIHLLPKGTLRSDSLLLISNPEGDKFQISGEVLLTAIKEAIAELMEGTKEGAFTLERFMEVFGNNSSINLVKPLNIANSSTIEKEVKDAGTIYCNGDNVRILTSKGWRTIKLEDE